MERKAQYLSYKIEVENFQPWKKCIQNAGNIAKIKNINFGMKISLHFWPLESETAVKIPSLFASGNRVLFRQSWASGVIAPKSSLFVPWINLSVVEFAHNFLFVWFFSRFSKKTWLLILIQKNWCIYLFIYLFMYASCRCGTVRSFDAKIVKLGWYMGSSTETDVFQVYEILKINHEFLQFSWLGSKI